jgi:hypothetical protein
MTKRAILIEPPKFPIDELYVNYDVEFIIANTNDAIKWRAALDTFFLFITEWVEDHWDDGCYLVVTGNLSMLTVASSAITDQWGSPPKLICYDALRREYHEVLCGCPA